jgi:hypothetical protein
MRDEPAKPRVKRVPKSTVSESEKAKRAPKSTVPKSEKVKGDAEPKVEEGCVCRDRLSISDHITNIPVRVVLTYIHSLTLGLASEKDLDLDLESNWRRTSISS